MALSISEMIEISKRKNEARKAQSLAAEVAAAEAGRQAALKSQVSVGEKYKQAIADRTLSEGMSPRYTLSQRATQTESEALDRLLTSKEIQMGQLRAERSVAADDDKTRRDVEGKIRQQNSTLDMIQAEKDRAEYKEKYLNDKNQSGFMGRFESNLDMGRLSQDEARAWNAVRKEDTVSNRKLAQGISDVKNLYAINNSEALAANGLISKSLAGYLPQFKDQLGAQIKGAAAGGLAGSAIPGLGTAAGIKIGAVAATGLQSYEQMAGAAYKSLLDAGVPDDLARRAAGDEALVSSIIEMADTGIDIATLGVGTLVNNLTRGGVKTTAKLLAKEGTEEAAESALKKFIKGLLSYGINVAGEGAQEGLQQVVSIANENRTREGKETGAAKLAGEAFVKSSDLTEEERSEVWDSAKEGMKIAAMMGAATKVGTSVINRGYNSSNDNLSDQPNTASQPLQAPSDETSPMPKENIPAAKEGAQPNALYAAEDLQQMEDESRQGLNLIQTKPSMRNPFSPEEAKSVAIETNKIKSLVAGSKNDIVAFFSKWKNGRKQGEKFERLYLGKISDDAKALIESKMGQPLAAENYSLSSDSMRHFFVKHGDSVKEGLRGQKPISDEQIASIMDVIEKPDNVEVNFDARRKEKGIVFEKQLPDGGYVYVQFELAGKKTLEGVSLRIKKGSIPMSESAEAAKLSTSETVGLNPYKEADGRPVETTNSDGLIDSNAATSFNQTISQNQSESNIATVDPLTQSLNEFKAELNEKQRAQFDNLKRVFGIHEPGENPAREVAIPRKTSRDRFVSEGARTMMEAGVTPDYAISEFERLILEGKMSHEVITDKSAAAYAENLIKSEGWEKALSSWRNVANGNGKVTKNDIALGQTLYNQAVNAKDVPEAMRLAQELVAEATRAGQNLQAQRILKTMTPDGQLYGLERTVQRINREIAERYKAKYPEVRIDETLVAELLNATDEEGITAAVDKIKRNIADQLPVTMVDRWNQWRYLSMLGNPRTHIRNLAGNTAMMGLVAVKNKVGAAIERGAQGMGLIEKDQRTKSFTKNADAVEFARQDYRGIKEALSGNKYDDRQDIMNLRKVLPGVLDKLAKGNSWLLDAEDVFFKQAAYVDSFSQAMTARGLTAEFLNSKEGQGQLADIREYAMNEALKATFQDASKLASAINNFSRSHPAASVLIEGTVPFKKTPINIVKRGLEYSPAGLLKTLTTDLAKMERGDITGAQFIDGLSANLTGSGALALGAFLASQGLLSASADDEAEERLGSLQGMQKYAINVGDYNYTVDWMAPAILPVIVGAEAYKAAENKGMNFSEFLEALSRVVDPVFELTMMDGLNDFLKTAAYGGTGSEIGNAAVNSALNYIGQGVPTLAGQVARTIDDTRRYSSYADKNNQVPDTVEKFINRNIAKIPGLSQTLPASIDQWGRKDQTDNLALRAFENLLSPGYISKRNTTKVDTEISRLYDKTGESGLVPKYPAKYFKVDGKNKYLTAKEYEAYSQAKGKTQFECVMSFLGNKDYDNLRETEKAEAILDAYSYSNAVAKTKVSNYKLDGWMEKAAEAEKLGIPITTYVIARNKTKDIHAEEQTSPMKKAEIDAIKGLSQKQREYLYEAFEVAEKYWKTNERPKPRSLTGSSGGGFKSFKSFKW